jgi:AraC-like DNA-binding protein
MAKKLLPIYNIDNFRRFTSENDFYANSIKRHIAEHHFTVTPHKHDFYLTVLFTKGSGTHDIDFTSYAVKPLSAFTLSPGQTHNWNLSKDIDGYVFFHTKNFYDEASIASIKNFPFFNSIHNPPVVSITNKNKINTLFAEIKVEYENNDPLKFQKLHALVTLVYIELSRSYNKKEAPKNQNYLSKVRQLEDLIDVNFKTMKHAHEYASLMAMSEKHLNRICKTCLNKTTADLITNRIILEAKRDLTHTNLTVGEVAEKLGYFDNSYFARLFKKKSGQTPIEFMKKNRH